MVVVSFLLMVVCTIALIVGLIKPDFVVRWGDYSKRNRKSVLKYYGIGIVLFFVLAAVFSDNLDEEPETNMATLTSNTQEEINEIDKSASIEIDSKILALSGVDSISLNDSEQIESIRSEYDSLSQEQKGYATNIAVLTTAEKKLSDLRVQAEKDAAAQAQAIAEQQATALQVQADQAAAAQVQTNAPVESTQIQNSYTVYITQSGDKFHSDGCQYLKKSKIAITKDDALGRGYSACSRCNP